jgi:hypothetical protein
MSFVLHVRSSSAGSRSAVGSEPPEVQQWPRVGKIRQDDVCAQAAQLLEGAPPGGHERAVHAHRAGAGEVARRISNDPHFVETRMPPAATHADCPVRRHPGCGRHARGAGPDRPAPALYFGGNQSVQALVTRVKGHGGNTWDEPVSHAHDMLLDRQWEPAGISAGLDAGPSGSCDIGGHEAPQASVQVIAARPFPHCRVRRPSASLYLAARDQAVLRATVTSWQHATPC